MVRMNNAMNSVIFIDPFSKRYTEPKQTSIKVALQYLVVLLSGEQANSIRTYTKFLTS